MLTAVEARNSISYLLKLEIIEKEIKFACSLGKNYTEIKELTKHEIEILSNLGYEIIEHSNLNYSIRW